MKKSRLFFALSCIFGISSISLLNLQKTSTPDLRDVALLALIKNDLGSLEAYIKDGGNLDSLLPELDGKNLTVAEGIAHFERVKFAHYLRAKKYPFTKQRPSGPDDVLRIAVKKNNPELMKELLDEEVDLSLVYEDKGRTLLHFASEACSDKILPLFKDKRETRWDQKASDGSTPLTIAAERGCLPVLSFLRENRADFGAKDGRGKSVFTILRERKDPILASLGSLFREKSSGAVKSMKVAKTPELYKKRVIPKDQIIDHSALLEPEDRPLEAIQTAEYSEFSD